MFTRNKTRRHFHVSTQNVYMPGKKGLLKRIELFVRPHTKRGVYRVSSGSLLAL